MRDNDLIYNSDRPLTFEEQAHNARTFQNNINNSRRKKLMPVKETPDPEAPGVHRFFGSVVIGGDEEVGTVRGNLRIRYFYRDTITGEEKIHTQWLNKGEDGVYPSDVGDVAQTENNPALIFQRWHYAQSKINNVQIDIDVGAIYITADGKTYFNIRITRTTGTDEADALSQTIYLNRTTAGTLSLNWGDGTDTEEITTTGNFNRSHTYSQIGDYWVTAWISAGEGTFSFGNNNSVVNVFSNNRQIKRDILRRVFIGDHVLKTGTYAFFRCQSLVSVTIPNGLTHIEQQAFNSCSSLTSIIIPNSVTTLSLNVLENCHSLTVAMGTYYMFNNYMFNNCHSLTSVTFSSTHTGTAAFQNCYSLKSISTTSITSIAAGTFQNCYSLIEYVINRSTPPTLGSTTAFTGINSITKIFVPDESVEDYKTATNWNTYALYIFPMSERRTN